MFAVNSIVLILLGANIQFAHGKTLDQAVDLEESELIFAHVIYRHGERNAMESYPTDPYKDESPPGGYGALTKSGKMQHFELGKYLRDRYQNLIGPSYSADRVYIRSTDEDRNLQSALCNAAGMFPPSTNDEKWKKDLDWQPIPVHTLPWNQDFLLNSQLPCPRYDKMFWEYRESQESRDIFEAHKSLIDNIIEHSGSNITHLGQLYDFYNIIFVQANSGLNLPEWVQTVMKSNETLDYLGAVSYEAVTHSTEMKKMKGGFLLKEILDRSKNKTLSLLKPNRNLYLYAAHGSVIVNILNTMNLYDLRVPYFASSVHFDLYKQGTEFYIQVYYRKTVSEDTPPLEIPSCGTKCPLDKFYELYKDVLPTEDYDMLCRLN